MKRLDSIFTGLIVAVFVSIMLYVVVGSVMDVITCPQGLPR